MERIEFVKNTRKTVLEYGQITKTSSMYVSTKEVVDEVFEDILLHSGRQQSKQGQAPS